MSIHPIRSLFLVVVIMSAIMLRAAEPAKVQELDEVLVVREAAWRAWFAGDEAALRSMLPAEFLAISADATEVADLEKTVTSSLTFKKGGGKLVSLSFPETRAQRFGDTVVLYGSFDAKIASGGAESTFAGQLTEIFVKREGRWVHPGWHLAQR